METLEELRKEFSNLDEQRNAVYEKILKLEQQEVTNNFAVGECYFEPRCESFKKIIKIGEGVLYCIVIEDKSIERDFYYLCGTKYWKKITSEQFRDVYHAVIKDIIDPDFEDNEESNFDIALKSIYNSINKGNNMAIANFEIGNKEFEVRFISELGYPPTKNERGSSLVEYDVTTYKDNQPMIKKFNKKRRVYFNLEGNVYKDKQSNKVWFNLFKAS